MLHLLPARTDLHLDAVSSDFTVSLEHYLMSFDILALLKGLTQPFSNEQYIRDQQTLTNLFKEPGGCDVQPR